MTSEVVFVILDDLVDPNKTWYRDNPMILSAPSALFLITTLLTLLFFYKASHHSRSVFIVLASWLVLQGIVAYTGFYTVTDTMPPRFALLVGPAVITIIMFFLTTKGRAMMDTLDTTWLTYLHLVRIPVEITLYWLFLHKLVPELMTFTGRNFDIIAGITAPLVAYYGYNKPKLGRSALIGWNFLGIALLLNIVIIAALSAPFPFQKFALEQPNIAVLHFPYAWLPGFIVPVVMFSHLVCLRTLLKNK